MDPTPLILALGIAAFPILVTVLAAQDHVTLGSFVRMLWKTGTASGYNIEVSNLYAALIFGPNVVGVLATLISQFNASFGLPSRTVLEIQYYHLTLLVLASVATGLTRVGGQRVLPLFVGEIVGSWAFLSGVMLFVYFIVLAEPAIGAVPTMTMVSAVLLFTVLAFVFMVEKSAGTYVTLANGTDDAETKPKPASN